jgi:hypothetical protein
VPVERIELPTFGLQNRCSTAELNRRMRGRAARISDLKGKDQNPVGDEIPRLGNWTFSGWPFAVQPFVPGAPRPAS